MQTKYLHLVSKADNGKSGDLRHARHVIQIKELQIDLCHSLAAPIRKLPVETLCAIFSLCIPPGGKRLTHRSAPFVLCLVSKAWRDIAMQDPTLWSRIHFEIPTTLPHRHPGGNRENLRSLIRRARSIPLTVSIIQTDTNSTLRRFYELLHLLAECTPLCRHLLIESCFGWTSELNSLTPGQLQRLESVSLRFRDPFLFGAKPHVFSSLPKLQTAELYTRNPKNMLGISLPSQSLLKLSVILEFFYPPAITVDNLRKFVTRFPNLQRLQVVLYGKGFSHPGFLPEVVDSSKSLSPTTFRSLKEITIRCGFRASLCTILGGFSFPALESLDLDAVSVPVRVINRDLIFSNILRHDMSYLSRLTNLRLIRIDIEDDQLRELLRFAPLLISLDIMRGRFKHHEFLVQDNDLLEFLTVSDDMEEEMLPPLVRLTYLRLYFYPEHAGLYANMALSRHRWAVKQLDAKDQASSPFYSATTAPRYPFRLHLKIQKADWEERRGVINSLGGLAGRILHTERCHSFMRGKI